MAELPILLEILLTFFKIQMEVTNSGVFQGQKGELVHMWEKICSLGKVFYMVTYN